MLSDALSLDLTITPTACSPLLLSLCVQSLAFSLSITPQCHRILSPHKSRHTHNQPPRLLTPRTETSSSLEPHTPLSRFKHIAHLLLSLVLCRSLGTFLLCFDNAQYCSPSFRFFSLPFLTHTTQHTTRDHQIAIDFAFLSCTAASLFSFVFYFLHCSFPSIFLHFHTCIF